MEIIFSFFLIREQTRSLLQLTNQLQTINLSEGWIKLFLYTILQSCTEFGLYSPCKKASNYTF